MKFKGISYKEMIEGKIQFIFPLEKLYFMGVDNQTNPICYLSTAYKNHDMNKPTVYGSLYADNLQDYLEKSVLNRTNHRSDVEEFPKRNRKMNYWIKNNTH